jgi:hypothetical protein
MSLPLFYSKKGTIGVQRWRARGIGRFRRDRVAAILAFVTYVEVSD